MKLKLISMLAVAIVALSAFKNSTGQVSYSVVPEKSQLKWFGKKVTGTHNGTVSLKSGSLTAKGKSIVGGNFVIDMNSIKDADGSEKLEGHLKAEDFFGTEKFPTSTFVITKVATQGSSTRISGNLTIKGISKPLEFPAKIVFNNDGTLSALVAKITVDRTKYGIRYGSKSFFDSIGDKAIDDNFEISINLAAKK